jgi:hypothetical protein
VVCFSLRGLLWLLLFGFVSSAALIWVLAAAKLCLVALPSARHCRSVLLKLCFCHNSQIELLSTLRLSLATNPVLVSRACCECRWAAHDTRELSGACYCKVLAAFQCQHPPLSRFPFSFYAGRCDQVRRARG